MKIKQKVKCMHPDKVIVLVVSPRQTPVIFGKGENVVKQYFFSKEGLHAYLYIYLHVYVRIEATLIISEDFRHS